jgi:hypothetical protein
VLSEANLSALYGIDVRVSEVEVGGARRRVCIPRLAA